MKKTPNQIREEVRRQMANQRDAEIEQLKADKERYWKMFEKADMAYKAKSLRVEELEEKVKQLEDWNRRLMEFLDMNEEERKAALEEYQTQYALDEALSPFWNQYMKILGSFV